MREATTLDEVRAAVAALRGGGATIGFVPTMGALHAGHVALLRRARDLADRVVLSIYVNPTQFGPGEDLAAYPRDLDRDRALAREAGADLLFRPDDATMYPDGFSTEVRVRGLSEPLCGASRPGHFDGVALVVTKLLNAVRPDVSVFGRKDAQQALVVRRLARDLHLPGAVVTAPTVREADGLAMSSRNRYLSPDERVAARAIPRGLERARRAWVSGERSATTLRELARAPIDAEPLLEPEYVELRERERLEDWPGGDVPALLAVAVRAGRARLIDNLHLGGDDADDDVPIPGGDGEGKGPG